MKTLLSTTAILIAFGLPTLTFAQTEAPAEVPGAETGDAAANAGNTGAEMAGFLNSRGQSDIYASELMGMDVYARQMAADTTTSADVNAETTTEDTASDAAEGDVAQTNDDAQTMPQDGNHTGMTGMASMDRSELDGMENIGQITEVVLSNDGQIRAIVIGIGGFLGLGEQDAAVTMDQVSFATDAEDPSQMYVVVNTGLDMLRTAPAYDRTSMMSDDMQTGMADDMAEDTSLAERTAFAAPQIERDGYNRVEVTDVSTELLMDKSVYDVTDADVGTVTDMIIDDSGKISDIIIDFGGFLGMGVRQASLSYDELTILSTDGNDDVRLYVDATKEQIEALPDYEAAN